MKKLFFLAALPIICCIFSVWFLTLMFNAPGGLRIEEIALTTNLEDQAPPYGGLQTFDQTDQRIYAIIKTKSIFGSSVGVDVVVRWYYEDTQIASETLSIIGSKSTIVWLDPPKDQIFNSGNYRLTIEINRLFTKTVEFVIN